MAHPPPGSLHAATCGMYPVCPLFDFQGSARKKYPLLIRTEKGVLFTLIVKLFAIENAKQFC